MKSSIHLLGGIGLIGFALLSGVTFPVESARAQQSDIPEVLRPWQDWATWKDKHQDCPTPFDSPQTHICFWPSRLTVSAGQMEGSWNIEVVVFSQSWIPLPGSGDIWPLNVLANGKPIAVVEHEGIPSAQLSAGRYQLSGVFAWDQIPQRLAIPKQIGLLSLLVESKAVSIPTWDAKGDLWLRRLRSEVADKDHLSVQVYRVLEDGVPMWLRTEIELTVSGKSREEELGWILPEGWKLSIVDSPIPVAVDERGRMKAQVRTGKWTIRADAFRSVDVPNFQFAADAQPITNVELIGFQAQPEFRLVEFEGLQAVDVTQTTFPAKWRGLPVYQWNTASAFQVVEKMRGMGLRRPEGLTIHRQFWFDEDGKGLTYVDHINGQTQQIWRLDVAKGQKLGAVRIDDKGQLITANPLSGAHGVELRTRNLNLQAIGRMDRTAQLSATGWRADAESLDVTLTLPPGWRVFALLGADRVEGDWLTAWSLLDLFLLLIFSLAVYRIWGVKAGVVAFVAFVMSYHELGSPRYTWLFLLMPLALLRVVPEGFFKRWIIVWKYVALAFLVMFLIPFFARQIQSAIYPQLESRGVGYSHRFNSISIQGQGAFSTSESIDFLGGVTLESAFSSMETDSEAPANKSRRASKFESGNLKNDAKARIQTGPAEPTWSWNQVHCTWNGPVSADQQIRPILISLPVRRVLTVLRLSFLLLLVAILLGVRGVWKPFTKRSVGAMMALALFFLPSQLYAQIPDSQMLSTLRERLLETSDAYPNAAEIPSVQMSVNGNRMTMVCEIHAAIEVAVPLPGRLPVWSPVSVKIDDQTDAVVSRREGYLWVIVPQGVHKIAVEGLLPDATQWEWTYLLKPRRISIDAPAWTVTGVRPNGTAEQQIFFRRIQRATQGEAAYDRKDFSAIVSVNRYLEIGLNWQLRTEVTRLSQTGKAVSLNVPLLAGESVLSTNVVTQNGSMEVRLGAAQKSFTWESELPIGEAIHLAASETDQWVESWRLVTSPVWNASLTGLAPVLESDEQDLIPVWRPWPGESVDLSFSKPEAVSGEIITVRNVNHETSLGSRQRTTQLNMELECSLGSDFVIELNPEADITSLNLDGRMIPVRRDGSKLIIPLHPGRQSVEIAWKTFQPMRTVVVGEQIKLPVDGSNITTILSVPDSRWILWADGPLRGPAVRFWTILAFALLAACVLGSLSLSPLRRWEWALLALGLTQVSLFAAMFVVGWLFLLAWRGKQDKEQMLYWRFNLLQISLVTLTLIALGVLIVVVGEGLLGNPEMFILGNGSYPTWLQWSQPRAGTMLPEPRVVSISVWFYRLSMLFWALWLATALLRWLRWGWTQFSHGGGWKKAPSRIVVAVSVSEKTS